MPYSLDHIRVTFTGKLASLTRDEAYQVVRNAGGEPATSVSRHTSMLVVGMEGWPLLPDGKISRKLTQAEELSRNGHEIEILSEAQFLERVGLKEKQSAIRKTYPANEVCKILKLPLETLRRWEQFSLIESEDGLYDFQDLVTLRTISDLVRRGVSPGTIARSLRGLASVLPGTDRPLAQLKIVTENPKVILANLGEYLIGPDGQLTLNFETKEPCQSTVVELKADNASGTDWFEYGQVCEDEERFSEAEEAYRRAILLRPHFPEAYFNLGNLLRILGRNEAAEELYSAAAAQDPAMACAWYNLADIQEERGAVKEAISSLRSALKASPNYADAHFNLALCYEKLQLKQDAQRHWSAYLKLDPSSPWATVARGHLSSHHMLEPKR